MEEHICLVHDDPYGIMNAYSVGKWSSVPSQRMFLVSTSVVAFGGTLKCPLFLVLTLCTGV
jgi:hypothetical protein